MTNPSVLNRLLNHVLLSWLTMQLFLENYRLHFSLNELKMTFTNVSILDF